MSVVPAVFLVAIMGFARAGQAAPRTKVEKRGTSHRPSSRPATPTSLGVTRDADRRVVEESIARLLEQKGSRVKALKAWGKLLNLEPKNTRYMLHVAVLADDLKRYRRVLPLARRLIAENGKDLRLRLILVDSLLALRKPKEASRHLRWLLPYRPKDVSLRRRLAGVFSAIKKPVQALVHYDWLIQHDPKNASYRFARAFCYGELRRHDRRLEDLSLLVQRWPKDVRYRLERASCYGDLSQPKRELAELRRAWKLAPKSGPVMKKIVIALLGADHRGEAKRVLRSLRKIDGYRAWALAQVAKMEREDREALRQALRRRRAAERYEDALEDLQDRAEDF